ncbi:cytochrome P450 [Nocardia donostiensis]|uniref:cytochrome P450 n=1 Tax=Nocardia donostiensis TaxID=1538463 RepID=UPI00158BDBFE|nr:cytochrome P450 [Nocardia donostiensis]
MAFLSATVDKYGDVATVEIPRMPFVMVNHPDHVNHILKKHQRNYDRHGPAHDMARNFFGNGLATAARPGWLAQRRLLQPAFHRKHITEFGAAMADTIATTMDRWETVRAGGGTLDLTDEMSDLTLRIVVRALFGMDPEDAMIRRFTGAVATATRELAAYMQFPLIPLSVPTLGHRRFRRALATMDEIVYTMIERQRREVLAGTDSGSLLSLMVRARDADTGASMDDEQLRDEVRTMLFAGHETSANTLAWAWYSIGRHPEVEQRLREEVDRVLGDRQPTMDDVPALTYTRQVILETLRMYAPAWQNFRQAEEDDEIDGFRIPAGTLLFWSYYLVHRHPDFWEQPDRFDPNRFTGQDGINGEAPAFFPFGTGPRLCIGNTFAMTEMQLAIVMILQRFRLEPVDSAEIAPKASVTLKMAEPLIVRLAQAE